RAEFDHVGRASAGQDDERGKQRPQLADYYSDHHRPKELGGANAFQKHYRLADDHKAERKSEKDNHWEQTPTRARCMSQNKWMDDVPGADEFGHHDTKGDQREGSKPVDSLKKSNNSPAN